MAMIVATIDASVIGSQMSGAKMSIAQADHPMSCSRRTSTASAGTIDASTKIAPTFITT
jgi:hypothetical protein